MKRFSDLLAAVWNLDDDAVISDLDVGMSTFGCWDIHRGPINQMLATFTGILRNRLKRKKRAHDLMSASSILDESDVDDVDYSCIGLDPFDFQLAVF